MADVFISYTRDDQSRIRSLAAALQQAGFSVWWDRQLLSGDEFSAEIERELAAAEAVIVCWSVAGAKSRWVRDEASLAADGNKLISVSLDASDPPIGFRQYHCVDLSTWDGRAGSGAVTEVERACQARVNGVEPSKLADSATPGLPVTSGSRWPARGGIITVVIVAAALVAGLWLAAQPSRETVEPAETAATQNTSEDDSAGSVRRYGILLPEHAPVDFIASSPLRTPVLALAITPDGNNLIYTGPSPTERSQLFVRNLAEFEARALPGTGGAYQPFVSPDGLWIAFFAYDELRVVQLNGRSVRTVLSAPNPRGGAWWGNDRIIYADREGANTWWVGINGGVPQPVGLAEPMMPDGRPIQLGENWTPLPDGERFLVNAFPGIETFGRLCIVAPATGQLSTVIDLAVFGRGANGALVYVMGNDLLAVDFDNVAGTVSGDARNVGSELRRDGTLPQFVLSDQTLIYATGAPYRQRQVALVGLDGRISNTAIADSRFADLAVSPDGRQVAATLLGNNLDIWIYSLDDGRSRRLTRGGDNHHPMWSDDSNMVYFKHESSDLPQGMYRTPVNSAGFEKQMVIETQNHFDRISPGNLATLAVQSESGRDYSIVNLETGIQTMVASQPDVAEDLGDVSPDGRWMALTVDASGRYEVVVTPLFRDGPTMAVSVEGGEEPLWAADMSELYFRYGTRLFRSSVQEDGDRLAFGIPQVIVDDPRWVNVGGYSYWPVASDGFLLMRENQSPTTRELRVVHGWRNIKPGE